MGLICRGGERECVDDEMCEDGEKGVKVVAAASNMARVEATMEKTVILILCQLSAAALKSKTASPPAFSLPRSVVI